MLLNQLERQLRRLMMHTKHWAVAAMSPTSLSLLYNHTRWLSNKLFWLYRLKEFYHLFDKSYYTFVCTEKKNAELMFIHTFQDSFIIQCQDGVLLIHLWRCRSQHPFLS